MSPRGPSDELEQIGNYLLLEKLGEGGMGQVYRARHQSTGRIVALKVLPVELMQDESTLKRYAREITLAQQVKHPHVARVHEVSTGDTRAWYAMEYVAGVDLQRHIDQHGPISLEAAADYVLQVARALVYLHDLAVIHRDIKPANLILTPEGRIKVVDLGLARCEVPTGSHSTDLASQLTATGMAMGTVDYIAPEQILDAKSVDGRADLYSLGCVLYYLVHGRPPFQRETEVETLLAHTEASIPTLSNRRDSNARKLNRIFRQLLAKSAAERIPSAEALVAELQNPSTAFPSANQIHRVAIVSLAFVLVGLASLAFALWRGEKPATVNPHPSINSPALAEHTGTATVDSAADSLASQPIIRVGPDVGMVTSLAAAFVKAADGDTIEFHTNAPQLIEPNTLKWRKGALTIRAAEGYQPMIVRQNGVPGPLLQFNSSIPEETIVMQGLAIINISAERPEHHAAIVTHNSFEMQRCLLLSYSGGLYANHEVGLDVRITDSYIGVYWPEGGFWPTLQVCNGRMTVENSLLVGNANIYISTSDTSAELTAERNSLIHSRGISLDGVSKVTSRGNLFAHCPQLVGTNTQNITSADGALALLDYSGERNLFFQSAYAVWSWSGEPRVYRSKTLENLEAWNTALGDREHNPSEADPRFSHPELVQAAKSQLVHPSAFAVQADSPLSSDKIGVDLARLPPFPPGLASVVPEDILNADARP